MQSVVHNVAGIVSYPTACDAPPGWLSAGEVSDASRALRVLEAACDCVEPWGPGLEESVFRSGTARRWTGGGASWGSRTAN